MWRWLGVLALVVSACSGSDPGIDGVGEDAIVHGTRIHPMPMRSRIIHQPPDNPSFTYYGGPLIGNAKVVEVLWGNGVAHATELGRFYGSIVASEYFDLLSEYGTEQRPIGRGSFVGLVTHPSPPGPVVDDVVVQTELARLLHQKILPENDDDTIYVVHFPPGVTITHSGAASCESFCAYHGSFRRNGDLVPYVVIPDLGGACSLGCGTADQLSNTTWVASHELAQVVTNPAIGFAANEASAPLAWFDPAVGEISDACAGSAQIGGFVVQTQWSRTDARCRFGSSQTSSFTIGVSPTAQTVRAGTSATILVGTTATAPDAPLIALEAAGLPDGVTASFNPPEVMPGKSSVLSFEASADAPGGTADITVRGRAAGDVTESTTVKLTVDSPRPGNDFSFEMSPVTQAVRRGQTVKFTATTAVLVGDAEPIMLTVSGLPSGVSGTFSPMIVGAGGSSELTISAGPGAALGSALLAITATARAKTRMASVSLDVEDVPPANDYTLAIAPASRTFVAGTTTTFTVSTNVTSGQPQNIALTASGLPSGVTYSFEPSMVVAGATSTLTLSAAAGAPGSTTPFTVTGTAPSGTRTTTATVTVEPAPPQNDFSVAIAPASRSLAAGQSTTFTLTTAVTSGNPVSVAFAISGLPTGVTAIFEPSSVLAGESATLRLEAALDASLGTVPLTVTGASTTGNHAAQAEITVTAPPPSDFGLAVAPSSQSVTAGDTVAYVVTTMALSGQPETIALSATSLPSGVSARFTPPSVLAGGTSTLELTADEDAAAGTDSFNVRGMSPSFTRSTSASITVTSLPPPSDFSLAVTPETRELLPGGMVTYSIVTAVTSGSAQTIALEVEGLPAGVTGSFNPTSVLAGGTSTLTLSASPTAPPAVKTFSVSGDAASGTRVDTAEIEVLPAPITNLIVNGDFETGDLTGWDVDVGVAVNVANAHHGGERSARVGSSTLYVHDSGLYQPIDVPSGKTTALTFWVYPRCPEIWGSQQAYVLDEDGFIIRTIFDACDDSGAWEKIAVDLTPYAGRSVYLYLRVRDYGFAMTWMYLDDVQAMSQ